VTVNELIPNFEPQSQSNDFLFDLPKEFGGDLDSAALSAAKDSMQTFDITTGAAKAQDLFQKAEVKQQE
jgi:hypothetical protein